MIHKPQWLKMELLRLFTPAFGALALVVLGFIWQDIRDVRTSVSDLSNTTAKAMADVRERVARLEAKQ